jgi:streptomycin 6-kinase
MTMTKLSVPDELAESHRRFFGRAGTVWIAGLPGMAEDYLSRWDCTLDGTPGHGAVAWVLPVRTNTGEPAVLKLQPVDDETVGEPVALRIWDGNGAVRLLRDDPATGAMLLERADPGHTLDHLPDDLAALQILSELLARLTSVPATTGTRQLSRIAQALVERAGTAAERVADEGHRRLITDCAAAVEEVRFEAGDRLLHWDLHYQNVLASAAGSGREPWLAIDPKPLAGDPGFDLLPALHNRWHDVLATGDVERALLRRFDLMTAVMGLDRERAAAWTLGRVLQNLLWSVEAGVGQSFDDIGRGIAQVLIKHRC